MRTFFIMIIFCSATLYTAAQQNKISVLDKSKKVYTVESACGQCKFGLEGKSCDLAIRLDGKAYFVDGTKIDDHGDAHAKDGFCNAIRKAEVQGEIVQNRFEATYFHLVQKKHKKKSAN